MTGAAAAAHSSRSRSRSRSNRRNSSGSGGGKQAASTAALSAHQGQTQQTPHSVSLSGSEISMASSMPSLSIGAMVEGLTEQQTAEVVELLTPFMSPAGTPAFGAASSMQRSFGSHHPATPLVLGQAGFASAGGAFVAAAATATAAAAAATTAAAMAGDQRRRVEEGSVFSPLTSPALVPQPPASRQGAYAFAMPMDDGSALNAQHQAQTAANSALSMPPPSPSITAEHMLRRQQQMLYEKYQQQQHQQQQYQALHTSPSFSSSPMFTYSPSASAIGRLAMPGPGGSAKPRRNTGGGGAGAGASPHHHPYPYRCTPTAATATAPSTRPAARTPSHSRPADADEFRLDALSDQSFAAAMVASLQNTPVQLPLHESIAAVSASIAGLNLPAAMVPPTTNPLGIAATAAAADLDQQLAASIAGNARDRTLHQLNPQGRAATPRGQADGAADHAATALAMAQQLDRLLGSAGHQGSGSSGAGEEAIKDDPPPTAAAAAATVAAAAAAATTATPASLMNLPLSAHHLPHTSTGEIISPAPAAATAAPIRRQATEKTTAVTLADHLARSIPVATPLMHFVTQSAPMTELIHPPLPPPLQIGPATSSSEDTRPAAQKNKRIRRKSISNATASDSVQLRNGPSGAVGGRSKVRRTNVPDSAAAAAARGRRRSRLTPLVSPRPTPLVPSTLKGLSPGLSPSTRPLVSPALPPLNPSASASTATLQHAGSHPGSTTATPQMRPRP
ncbi:hypothetical protein LPJ56_002082, partial [Coemansia sp. RSA 2599]